MVYAAANQSLAMLEMLVQDQPLRARYVIIEARIPAGLAINRVRIEHLPSDWREISAREKLRAIGTEWVRRPGTAVLAVPSAIVPAESNYLLNPLHRDFKRIKIGKPTTVETDLRLNQTLGVSTIDRVGQRQRFGDFLGTRCEKQ